jgi:hypothetical protein
MKVMNDFGEIEYRKKTIWALFIVLLTAYSQRFELLKNEMNIEKREL